MNLVFLQNCSYKIKSVVQPSLSRDRKIKIEQNKQKKNKQTNTLRTVN